MKTSTAVVVLIVLVLLGGGLYYWYAGQAPAAPQTAVGTNGLPNQGNTGGTTTGQNLILGISTSATLGTYLSAPNGMTLYTYSPDTANKSNCTGTCAANWPPYTVASAGDISVPASITGQVGTTARADGSLQVTYNGRPLYFYVKDTAPGQTTGQGVGGVWYVATP